MAADTIEIGAAYIRVSTDDQTELSPDAQLRVIKEAAKQDGYVIPPEFIFVEQKGISGRKAVNRPEFQRMIGIAKSQTPSPFKRLYVWKFSRFARNQEESVFYKSILRKKCMVDIKSVSEPIAEGMFGRLIESIIEWFDEYYSVNLSGEVLRGMTEKALRNGYQSAPCLGYKAVGGGKPFIIDPDKMRIVEFIHTAYNDGMDTSRIARECNRRGYLSQRGKVFEHRSIERILLNPFYIGKVTWNGITFTGTHELSPIVSNLFEKNVEKYKSGYRPLKRRDVSECKHWLSGIMKCGTCGTSLAYSKRIRHGELYATFQCWKYAKGMHDVSNSIAVTKAENLVLQSLKYSIETQDIDYEHIPKKNDSDSDRNILLYELSSLDKKEARIKDAYISGIDTIDEYKENKSIISKERKRLQSMLELEVAEERPSKEEFLKRINDVYSLLINDEVDFEEKGNAIRSIVQKIVYNKQSNTITIYYYS